MRRLPLPEDGAEVRADDQHALELLDVFVDRLAELPLEGWLSIGRDLAASDTLPVRQLAWVEVDTAIADRQLAMAAWYVRDAIETTVCLASRQASCWSREQRWWLASTHGAAEAAALALLARHYTSDECRRTLCAPFARQLEESDGNQR
jgi:hypothetical protein